MSQNTKTELPDHYAGELNTKRIKAYQNLAKQYNIDESTVRDLFCAGADWYKLQLDGGSELSDLHIQEIAESRGWRMIPDDEYAFGGYAVQSKRNFLGCIWWTDEYRCNNKEAAIDTLKKLIL